MFFLRFDFRQKADVVKGVDLNLLEGCQEICVRQNSLLKDRQKPQALATSTIHRVMLGLAF